MNEQTKHVLKSIWAIFAGFLLVVILSAMADFGMQQVGLISFENFKNAPTLIVVVVTLYRFIFNAVGSFITARLAPKNPMKLVMIGGFIGLLMSTLGAVAMWEKAAAWYNIAIIIIALPAAYLGGKVYIRGQIVNPLR
jgi:predicted membrane-bound mannosyltransferase